MKRIVWIMVLGSLVVTLAGCGASGVQPQQAEGATHAAPEATVAPLPLASAPSPSAQEPAATSTPRPTAQEPSPTSTPLPATEEPTSTSSSPPTATPTPPSPTLTTTAVPVAVFSAGDIQRIVPAEASALLDSGEAVLYDVRSEAEYQAQHAAGAFSLPGASVVARFGELPADKSLVFY
jgi:hypothetical protein